MPRRTNDFQELITLLTQIIGRDVARASVELPSKVPGVRDREVDIVAEGEVSGRKVVVGIECRASNRRLSIEWVERMYGKHQHLPIDKTVLVSSSGFTKGALKLAEFLGIDAITPEEVTPGFVGEIVNNLTSLWLERLDFTAEKILIHFDPPISGADRMEVLPPAWGLSVYRPDSTELCTVGDLVNHWIHEIDVSQPELRDAAGEQKQFNLAQDSPLADGAPIFLLGGGDSDPPALRQITRFEILGKLDARGVDMPLTHGQYDGANYSSGTASVGDHEFHLAVTEGDDGTRSGIRVIPASGDPASAQTFQSGEGTRMIRVNTET